MQQILLTELLPCTKGRITSVNCKGAMRRRLGDLGFVEGSTIEYAGKSPLGDPMAFRIKGTVIALRREESDLIRISLY